MGTSFGQESSCTDRGSIFDHFRIAQDIGEVSKFRVDIALHATTELRFDQNFSFGFQDEFSGENSLR